MDSDDKQRFIIDRDRLPKSFPTHRHSPHFWEWLGRTIATYGFLEEVLGKAVFAFTATRRYSPHQIEEAYAAWLLQIEKALTDQLWNLAESYGKAVRDNTRNPTVNLDGLVQDIKEATVIRNVLCHGSWRPPDENGGSLPLFVDKQRRVFETVIDVAFLEQVQNHVAELACRVMESVTLMGFQFPGSAGPGKPIIE